MRPRAPSVGRVRHCCAHERGGSIDEGLQHPAARRRCDGGDRAGGGALSIGKRHGGLRTGGRRGDACGICGIGWRLSGIAPCFAPGDRADGGGACGGGDGCVHGSAGASPSPDGSADGCGADGGHGGGGAAHRPDPKRRGQCGDRSLPRAGHRTALLHRAGSVFRGSGAGDRRLRGRDADADLSAQSDGGCGNGQRLLRHDERQGSEIRGTENAATD